MRAPLLVAVVVLVVGCRTSREVPLAEVWGGISITSPMSSGQLTVTSGVLTMSGSPGSCAAELSDGETHVSFYPRDALCEQAWAANGRRVRVEGTPSMALSMPDITLRPDAGGCEPSYTFSVSRIDVSR